MPGTVLQELTRIMNNMRASGTENVWLNPDNLQAFSVPVGKYSNEDSGSKDNYAVTAQSPQVQPAVKPAFAPQSSPAVQSTPKVFASARKEEQPAQAPATIGMQDVPKAAPAISPRSEADIEAIRNASLPDLDAMIVKCSACSLAASRRHPLCYAGHKKAQVLFIGDYPTAEEETYGKAFEGKAGEMLFKMAQAMGLKWDGADDDHSASYITMLKCRPVKPITEEQVQACLPMLRRQIELMSPAALVLLGPHPLKALVSSKETFSKAKGTIKQYKNIPALVIQHPVTIMRYSMQPEAFATERRLAWEALKSLMALLGLKR